MTLFQSVGMFSIAESLHYQWPGRTTLKSIMDLGNFGCGALKNFEAEVVLLDGCVYTIGVDGKVYQPSIDESCSVTLITRFEPKYSFELKEKISFDELLAFIKDKVPQSTNPYAIKCTGTFGEINGRSVYPHQNGMKYNGNLLPRYDYFDCKGTVIGYLFPRVLDPICGGDGGYHFHFLDETKTFGCHVFRANPIHVTVEIMPIKKFVLDFDKEDIAH